MKKLLVGAAATAMLAGCNNGQAAKNSSASGSLALSTDDSLLYAADTDNGVVSVISTDSDELKYSVKVGSRPMRVVVAPDDTVFVANRGSRSVSVIRKGEHTTSGEIATGVDPTGLAVSFDGKTLYIVSATAKDTSDYGILQAVDTATLEVKYEKNIGVEPRAIALVSNDKALVTQYKGGAHGSDVVEVNLKTGDVMNEGNTGLYQSINATKENSSGSFPSVSGFSSFKPRAATDIVVEPGGNRAFMTAVLAREDKIGKTPTPSGGYYSAGGPCNVGAVATEGVVTLDTSANSATQPRTDDLTDCQFRGTNPTDSDFPPTAASAGSTTTFGGTPPVNVEAVQGPSAAAVDPTGEWLYVVNKETSNVAVMPAWRRQARDGETNDITKSGSSFRSVVGVENAEKGGYNSGADGIALTKDGLRAYVYNQFDHQVVRLGNSNGAAGGPTSTVTKVKTIDLGLPDPAGWTDQQLLGRRYFFDAQSTILSSSSTHVSCATCHLEGRDDGHTWSFPDGERQTPTLVGRAMDQTGKLHWTGQFNSFNDFMSHTVIQRMGGSNSQSTDDQIKAFILAQPAPENPNYTGTLTAAQERGKVAFAKAECGTCHVGANFTDSINDDPVAGTFNVTHDVGTATAGEETVSFDTPSLKGLARSAPYLHDGSAGTLMDRITAGGTKHGNIAKLTTDQERTDLVEYLKTL